MHVKLLTMTSRLSVVAALGATLSLAASAAMAEGYHRGHRGGPSYVVAESNFGKSTVTGAVREGRNGLQVQLPGGSWIDCVRSCSDTLRRQTVDFWDNTPQGRDQGRGYLSWGRSY